MPSTIPVSAKWGAVRVALTAGGTDPLTIANGAVLDGLTLSTGDRFVCVGARADAGVYTVGASASVRSDDANEASEFVNGRSVNVTGGSLGNRGTWVLLAPSSVTLGSTVLTISYLTAEAIAIAAPTTTQSGAAGIPIAVPAPAASLVVGEILLTPLPQDGILDENGVLLLDEQRKPILANS
jgi:hypothetical protein